MESNWSSIIHLSLYFNIISRSVYHPHSCSPSNINLASPPFLLFPLFIMYAYACSAITCSCAIYTYIHAYIHTHTHTNIHTYIQCSPHGLCQLLHFLFLRPLQLLMTRSKRSHRRVCRPLSPHLTPQNHKKKEGRRKKKEVRRKGGRCVMSRKGIVMIIVTVIVRDSNEEHVKLWRNKEMK